MDEPVDDGHDAGCIGEDLAPFSERPVGGDDRGLAFVTPIDDLEQQIGMAGAIGEVADLIDYQDVGAGIVSEASAQRAVAVLCRQIAEHLGGIDEQRAVALHDRLMREVLSDQGFADAIGSDQDDVEGLTDKVQAHQRGDGRLVTLCGPVPVEVGQWLEAPEVGGAQAPLQAPVMAFLDFPLQPLFDPGQLYFGQFVPMGQQAVELERGGVLLVAIGRQFSRGSAHRRSPDPD